MDIDNFENESQLVQKDSQGTEHSQKPEMISYIGETV